MRLIFLCSSLLYTPCSPILLYKPGCCTNNWLEASWSPWLPPQLCTPPVSWDSSSRSILSESNLSRLFQKHIHFILGMVCFIYPHCLFFSFLGMLSLKLVILVHGKCYIHSSFTSNLLFFSPVLGTQKTNAATISLLGWWLSKTVLQCWLQETCPPCLEESQ